MGLAPIEMAHVLRPLFQWPQRWRYRHLPFLGLHSSPPHTSTTTPLSYVLHSTSLRGVHFRSRALRLRDAPSPSDESDDDSSSDGDSTKKSRNERKRQARRAVRWGMELASFSPNQIKRILRVSALEQDVYDALMVVKRLDRDVREGRRRQYSYIGRLLREVEPELIDGLIQAMKDGDQSKFQVSGTEASNIDEAEDIDKEDKEDFVNVPIAARWYDGLVNKDVSITSEIYSLQEVEFDRQELRQLVRKVHSTLETGSNLEENGKLDAAATHARRSLHRFLCCLAQQLPA